LIYADADIYLKHRPLEINSSKDQEELSSFPGFRTTEFPRWSNISSQIVDDSSNSEIDLEELVASVEEVRIISTQNFGLSIQTFLFQLQSIIRSWCGDELD
jgi:hypothetical protein